MSIFKETNLTKDNIFKSLMIFSLPILLSYVLQQIYTIADSAICGQFLNANEVAGVNNTANLVFIVLQFALGSTAGFSVITSNMFGQKNVNGIKKSFATQIRLGLYISVILTILAVLMINPLLKILGLEASEEAVQNEIYKSAYTYILIIYLGICTQIFYNLICSFLRSIGDSITPLIFLLISTVLNIILDVLFILPLNMGVAGAAIATVIAQGVSAVGCFIYTYFRYKEYRLNLNDFKIDFKFSLNHLKLGLPLAFQFSILAIGLIVMQSVIVQFDSNELGVVISSNAQNGFGAATKLNNLLMCPFNALGTALLTYCSQNLGSNNFLRVKKGVKCAIIIAFVEYIIFAGIGLLMTINGFYLHIFYSSDKINDEAIKFGNSYMYCDMTLYFVLGILFIFRNSVQGLGKPLFPFLAGIGELTARSSVCLIFPKLLNGADITTTANKASMYALSMADPCAWIFACIFLLTGGYLYIYSKNAPKRLGIEKSERC